MIDTKLMRLSCNILVFVTMYC